MGNHTSEFYDRFADRQVKAGIHQRHLAIQRWLEKFKMPRIGNFLEIGCGIGTQTELMLEYLKPDANLIAIDISKKSIKIAEERLKQFDNLTLITGNIISCSFRIKFDVIVLPDVLEHIPLEQHNSLFKKLSSLMHDEGFILIHIPHPHYLKWLQQNYPQKLQLIDNPIHTNNLLKHVYSNGLYIDYLESYSIFNKPADYQVIVLKKHMPNLYIPILNPRSDSTARRAKRRLRRYFRYI